MSRLRIPDFNTFYSHFTALNPDLFCLTIFNLVTRDHWRPQGGGGTGVMAPPLADEGGAILSFGPTFDVKGKR